MVDVPSPSIEVALSGSDPTRVADLVLRNRGAPTSLPLGESSEIIPVLEETLAVSKRRMTTGSVRVRTRTEVIETVAEAELDRYRVEVTRVSVGHMVDQAPSARAEGDTTIIPVIEERLVMVKQLFLVEELHIRHVLERKSITEPVTLRRQRATVERLDADGKAAVHGMAAQEGSAPAAEEGRHGFFR